MNLLFEVLFVVGAILVLVGWLWGTGIAFRERKSLGLLTFFVPPVYLFYYGPTRWVKTWRASLMIFVGVVALTVPTAYTRFLAVDLGPRDTMVNGERHITLTGWDQKDYSILRQYPDVAVLQMANEDVTDAVLLELVDMTKLRELDLSHSQVSDSGLETLSKLPSLQDLKLQKCRVTDEGFRKWLATHPRLNRLDLIGTEVSAEAIRDWRKADRDRRAMR
ncbi:MAG: hypothetical protein R3C01_17400 [Planctomycetaceae bacterium]